MSDREAEPTISKGLEDVVVAETRLSSIDGENGVLTIGGHPLSELALNATFEETVYLLWNDRLPNERELEAFRKEVASLREPPQCAMTVAEEAGEADAPAMDALRMGAAAASLGGESTEPHNEARRLIARLPTIVAAYWRTKQGEDVIAPREDLSHAANYLYMLTGEEPSAAQVSGMETYLNSVVDHGLNASTFTARTITSTESDVFSAVTGAIGALKGPLHGGAPGPVLEMILDAHERRDPETVVREILERGDRLMGFGHRVYSVRDPRAAVLEEAAEQFFGEDGNSAFFETARELERVANDLLEEYKPELEIETNVEFYTAVLLYGLGVPPELFTTTFAIARAGGWTAHCLEQRADNRLIRPRAKYVGEKDRQWVPIDQRE